MKIIISHDVDHLFACDHRTRDLIFPKLIVRSILHCLQGKIGVKVVLYRLLSVVQYRLNRIEEIIAKDKEYNIPSTFFFGMNQGLGMSYKRDEAVPVIQKVLEAKFDVGVHGIEFNEYDKMKSEFEQFASIIGHNCFGIRTHYVRTSNNTFSYMSRIGYLFDTSLFDKKGECYVNPYKIGEMWEFPLHIMDGYIVPPGDFEQGKNNTMHAIRKAYEQGIEYLTILYHDYQYNAQTYPAEKAWYDWLLNYISECGYETISYRDAIKELELNEKK